MISELAYVALLFGLFVLPKALQRFRLPSAITCLGLGVASGLGAEWFTNDPTIHLLSTFGIAALFLFAGLEVDGPGLRRGARVLLEHLVVQALLLIVSAWIFAELFGLSWRPAVLFALAILTPSTGFILDSIGGWRLTPNERFWVRTKAIAVELVALALLFVTMQSTSAGRLAVSAVALLALAAVLPFLFRIFASRIAPVAPNSEFAFLLMLAVVFAFATRQLGVYYLVGAFLVGVAAQRFRRFMPGLSSDKNVHAIEAFASFFVPFYFFNAGLGIPREALSWASLALGGALAFAMIPLRVASVILQRGRALQEAWRDGMRVGVPLIPTLVFTLVLARLLRENFALDATMYGALVVYTTVTTLLPTLALGAPASAVDFQKLQVDVVDVDRDPESDEAAADGGASSREPDAPGASQPDATVPNPGTIPAPRIGGSL